GSCGGVRGTRERGGGGVARGVGGMPRLASGEAEATLAPVRRVAAVGAGVAAALAVADAEVAGLAAAGGTDRRPAPLRGDVARQGGGREGTDDGLHGLPLRCAGDPA